MHNVMKIMQVKSCCEKNGQKVIKQHIVISDEERFEGFSYFVLTI